CIMILIFKLRYLLLNFISNSPYGLDQFLMSHDLSEFFPKMPDMDHNSVVVVLKIFFLPDLLKQILGTYDFPPVLCKNPENGEFQRRQRYFRFPVSTLMSCPV